MSPREHISSRVAFGTAALLGPRSRAQALGLLEAAFEAGITHLDTARGYASGDAEKVVGEFLARHPGEVTVTTKFGIVPATMSRSAAVRSLARRMMRVSPRLRGVLGRTSSRLSRPGRFDVDSALASIETSLRALGVECIDVLLLHEASVADCSNELLDLLMKLRETGVIGTFGVGTQVEDAAAIARDRPEFASVLQFPHSVAAPAPEQLLLRNAGNAITHGAFGPVPWLLAAMRSDEATRDQWSRTLDLDILAPGVLAGLALAAAAADNPSGAVLFSTTKEARVKENAMALEGPLSDQGRVRAFRQLVSLLRER